MVSLLRKIVGDSAEKVAEKIRPIATKINAMESSVQQLSDDQLRDKTPEFRTRIAAGESLEDLLVEAFAVVREAEAGGEIGSREEAMYLIQKQLGFGGGGA